MALGESRIQSEFTSDQNVTYKLSIYDSNLAFPATNSVTAGADGFTLTYDGKGKKRYEYIKASKVDFSLNVESNNDLVNLLDELKDAEQGRFKLKIEQSTNGGTSYSTFWLGVLTPDIIKRNDESYPYFVSFTATDGLALMRDVKFNKKIYNGSNENPEDLKTFIKLISSMLKYYNPTTDFKDGFGTFIFEHIHWYEDTMSLPAQNNSPLENAATYPNAFMGIELDAEGEQVQENPLSAYEVLEQLLKTWGARIVQRQGHWFIHHLEMYNHLATNNWYRRFNHDGVKLGSGTTSTSTYQKDIGHLNSSTDIVKLRGAIYGYLPKIQEVRASYSNWVNTGLKGDGYTLSGWPSLSIAIQNLENLGYAVATAGAGINITHRLQYRLKSGGTGQFWDWVKVIYVLKVGSYYWDGSQWTTTASSVPMPAFYVSANYNNNGWQDLGSYPQGVIQTDPFLTNGDIEFGVWSFEGNSQAGSNNFTDDWEVRVLSYSSAYPSSVNLSINNSVDVERTFSSSDDNTLANSIENLGECLLGDGPTQGAPSWGRIRVKESGGSWSQAIQEDWQAWGAGSVERITNILCEQTLAGQRDFTPLNQYRFLLKNQEAATFNPSICLRDVTNDNSVMVMSGYKFVANTDEISGEYWKATEDTTGLTNNNTTLNSNVGVTFSPNSII